MRTSRHTISSFIVVACALALAAGAGAPAHADAGRTLAEAQAAKASAATRPRIVFLGDSLTAGYGLERHQSVPSLIQARLDSTGYRYEVVNAGVSGDTSAGGLSRLDW